MKVLLNSFKTEFDIIILPESTIHNLEIISMAAYETFYSDLENIKAIELCSSIQHL